MKKTLLLALLGIGIISCGHSKAEKEAIKQQIIELKAQLAGEQSKLESIKSFQLLRSRDEKAQQVADETEVIEQLKSQINDLEKKLQ